MTHDRPEGSDVHEILVADVWNPPTVKLPRSNARVRIGVGHLGGSNVTGICDGLADHLYPGSGPFSKPSCITVSRSHHEF